MELAVKIFHYLKSNPQVLIAIIGVFAGGYYLIRKISWKLNKAQVQNVRESSINISQTIKEKKA